MAIYKEYTYTNGDNVVKKYFWDNEVEDYIIIDDLRYELVTKDINICDVNVNSSRSDEFWDRFPDDVKRVRPRYVIAKNGQKIPYDSIGK